MQRESALDTGTLFSVGLVTVLGGDFQMTDELPSFDFDQEAPIAGTQMAPVDEQSALHMRILQLVTANPGMKKSEIARAVGRSASTVGIIMKSNIFQDRLAAQNQMWEGQIFENLRAQLEETALEGLEKMRTLMRQEFDLGKVAPAVKIALGGLGLGTPAATGPSVTQVQVNLPVSVFESARNTFGSPRTLEMEKD